MNATMPDTTPTPQELADEAKRLAAEYYSTVGWEKGRLPAARETLHATIDRMRDALEKAQAALASAQAAPDDVRARSMADECKRLAQALWAQQAPSLDTLNELRATIDRMREALAAPQAAPVPQWQPIETAPSGEEVLLTNGSRVDVDDFGLYAKYNHPKYTHWMPLPEPPGAVCESAQPVGLPQIAAKLVPLTDERIEADFKKAGGRWTGDAWIIEDADLHPFVRSIATKAAGDGEAG